jgi:hypothetical protein
MTLTDWVAVLLGLGGGVAALAAIPPERRWFWRIAVALLVFAVVIAGIGTVLKMLIPEPGEGGPPRLDTDLTTPAGAQALAQFLKDRDGRIIYLHLQCEDTGPNDTIPAGFDANSRCLTLGDHEDRDPPEYRFVMSIGSLSVKQLWEGSADDTAAQRASLWVDALLPKDSGAEVFNGPRGAGWIEMKGYFLVTRLQFGDAPPGSIDYQIRAIQPSAQNIATARSAAS